MTRPITNNYPVMQLLLLFHPRKDSLITIGSIDKTLIDPADGRRRSLRYTFDFIVSLILRQQLCYLQSLRNSMDFIDRADILKKPVAIFLIFQKQHSLEQFIYVVSLEF